jgi:hypothetical protein
MKKHYFQHDDGARHDERITQLRMEHGAYGYGIYWMIIEAMHQSNGEIHDVNAFSFSINEDFEKVSEVIKGCLRVALFESIENGGIKSKRVINQIAQREEYIKKQKEYGRVGGLKKAKKVGYPKGSPSDETKRKEKKLNNTNNYVVDKKLKRWLKQQGKGDGYCKWLYENFSSVEFAWKKVLAGHRVSNPSDFVEYCKTLENK